MNVLLDHNATTPVLPEVLDAMLPWLRDGFGNPSSDHAPGRRARAAVEAARVEVAALLGADPAGVVFTGGGTEADNLAILGACAGVAHPRATSASFLGVGGALLIAGSPSDGEPRLVTTAIEHPAVLGPCAWLEQRGAVVARVRPEATGRVDERRVLDLLSPRTTLVSVMLAQNETGVLQPVGAIGAATRRLGIALHTDAAQAVGKVPVDVEALGVDLLTVVGHKLGAPKGVGALWIRPGTEVAPLLHGGGQERGIRPGTENVASIVALGAACRVARRDLVERSSRLAALRDRLEALLVAGVPGLRITGVDVPRLPNTAHVRFPGASGAEVLRRAAVDASTGSACHAGATEPSPVLVAMGLSREDALGAVRLSVGFTTGLEDVERAATAIDEGWRGAARG